MILKHYYSRPTAYLCVLIVNSHKT